MTDSAETFSRDWLELREPVDHRSRAVALLPILQNAWRERGWTRILDLGSGTGSNARYLSPRLPGAAWTLLDHNAELLRRAHVVESAESVTHIHGDLDDGGIRATAETDLVTCSALLDLVSERWLRRLVRTCRDTSCGGYFALSYNGVIRWLDDGDPDDQLIRDVITAHQQRDRGQNTALGPTAAAVAEELFRSKGYRTWRVPSPWRLTTADNELARALVDGWERAALELVGSSEGVRRIRAWAGRRRQTTRDSAMSLTVGHDDLLVLPGASDVVG